MCRVLRTEINEDIIEEIKEFIENVGRDIS